jgi:hypothetical protein
MMKMEYPTFSFSWCHMSIIPIELTKSQFDQHIAAFLSHGERGPDCQIPDYQVFNFILHWLHTGCQWRELVITTPEGEKKGLDGRRCMVNLYGGVPMAVFIGFGQAASR